jgi:hypothetical protein
MGEFHVARMMSRALDGFQAAYTWERSRSTNDPVACYRRETKLAWSAVELGKMTPLSRTWQLQPRLHRVARAHFGVLALTVVVFRAVAVAAVTLQVRSGLRDQIVRREAGWLEAIASDAVGRAG